MIVTENIEIRGKTFVRNVSDAGFYIKKDGTDEVYSEAVDLPDAGYTYSETDIPIEEDEEETEAESM